MCHYPYHIFTKHLPLSLCFACIPMYLFSPVFVGCSQRLAFSDTPFFQGNTILQKKKKKKKKKCPIFLVTNFQPHHHPHRHLNCYVYLFSDSFHFTRIGEISVSWYHDAERFWQHTVHGTRNKRSLTLIADIKTLKGTLYHVAIEDQVGKVVD